MDVIQYIGGVLGLLSRPAGLFGYKKDSYFLIVLLSCYRAWSRDTQRLVGRGLLLLAKFFSGDFNGKPAKFF